MATTTSLLLVSITFNAPSPPSNFRRTYYWLPFYKSTPLNQWLPRVWLLLNVTGAGCTIVAKVPCCHKRLCRGHLSGCLTLRLFPSFFVFFSFFLFSFSWNSFFPEKYERSSVKVTHITRKKMKGFFFGGMIQRRWRRHHRVSLCGAITSVALDIYGDLSIFSCLQIFQSPLLTTFMELFFGGPAF